MVPKPLRLNYELLRELEQKKIRVKHTGNLIELTYEVNSNLVKFTIDEMSSDGEVFRQVILCEEYAPVLSIAAEYGVDIRTIIDAGANVGYTSIYLLCNLSEASVCAIEPGSEAFKRLKRNVQLNQFNVTCVNLGLWSKKAVLTMDRSFRDGLDWSLQLLERDGYSSDGIEVVELCDIVTMMQWDSIDLLKMDIEGSEVEVFKGDVSWLKMTKLIAIEIHDEFGYRETIEGILTEYGFRLFWHGELTIGVNQQFCEGTAGQ